MHHKQLMERISQGVSMHSSKHSTTGVTMHKVWLSSNTVIMPVVLSRLLDCTDDARVQRGHTLVHVVRAIAAVGVIWYWASLQARMSQQCSLKVGQFRKLLLLLSNMHW